MPDYVNKFKAPVAQDFEILDGEEKKVGKLRVKPSGVGWKPKGGGDWYSVKLDQFIEWITDAKTKANRTKN